MDEDFEKLKQRLPLLDYLRQRNWSGRPAGPGSEFVGLCPLHPETRPSFYVNARKNLFYCHGCGQGGDLIRFVELSRRLSFSQSLTYLQQQSAPAHAADALERAAAFYQQQLPRHPEALRYLERRGVHDPALIEELRIGYAPGGNLRRHLTVQGYSLESLLRHGLVNLRGCDAFYRRVVAPCCQDGQVVNLYGRSIGADIPHRFLPGPRGGLFAWESVRQFSTVILVEGLLDLAVLWQAVFRNATCAYGNHLTPFQFHQLSEQPVRLVYIVFDQDENQSGQRAAHQLARRLAEVSVPARAWFSYQPDRTPTVTSLPAPRLPTSPDAWSEGTRYEAGPSICHPSRHLSLSPARRARPRNCLGQRFSGCPASSSTVASLAARLRL